MHFGDIVLTNIRNRQTHTRTHKRTDGQPENIMPPAPVEA